MTSHASSSHDHSAPRAFARLRATEVTPTAKEENRGNVFLTVYTDPDRPEPEVGIIGG
jgi:hypothetical protein